MLHNHAADRELCRGRPPRRNCITGVRERKKRGIRVAAEAKSAPLRNQPAGQAGAGGLLEIPGSLLVIVLWPVGGYGQADALTSLPDRLLDLLGIGISWRLVRCGHSGQISTWLHVERQAFRPGHLARRRYSQRPRSLVAVRRGIFRVVGRRAGRNRLGLRGSGWDVVMGAALPALALGTRP
jgi:hypothetical protein